MAEITRIEFTNKDLAILMLKDQGIHEGNWVLQAKFSFGAMNMGTTPEATDVVPSGIIGIAGMGLELTPQPLPFSINAAEVNPKK
ncbi:MAG: hypothetical protein WA435_11190 [Gallionellaceae bacterium]